MGLGVAFCFVFFILGLFIGVFGSYWSVFRPFTNILHELFLYCEQRSADVSNSSVYFDADEEASYDNPVQFEIIENQKVMKENAGFQTVGVLKSMLSTYDDDTVICQYDNLLHIMAKSIGVGEAYFYYDKKNDIYIYAQELSDNKPSYVEEIGKVIVLFPTEFSKPLSEVPQECYKFNILNQNGEKFEA